MKHLLEKLLKFDSPWYDKLFYYTLLLVSALVPLLFTFRVKSSFSLPKLYTLAALILAATAFLGVRFIVKKRIEIKKSAFNILLGLYFLTLVFSTIFSENIYSSLFGTHGRFMGFFALSTLLILVFFVGNFVRERSAQLGLIVGTYASGIVVVIIGLLQHYGFIMNDLIFSAEGNRAFGTMGHANHFGGYIVQLLCVSLVVFALVKNKVVRGAVVFLDLAFLLAILQTSSRGAVIALLGCTAFLTLIYAIRHKAKIKKILATLLIASIVLAATSFVFWDKLQEVEVVKRTTSTIEFIKSGKKPDRISWMLSSIAMIKDAPVLGHGVSTFKDKYNAYRRLDYRAPGEEQDKIVPEAAHNEYLNVAATQGIPSLIIYLILIGLVFKTAIKKSLDPKTSKTESAVLALLVASLLAYLLQVLISFGVPGTMIPFYLLLGVTYSYSSRIEGESEIKISPNSHSKKTQFSPLKKVSVLVLILGMFILSFFNLYYTHRIMKSDYLLRATEYLTTEEGYKLHARILETATKYNPYAYELYEESAGFHEKEGIRISQAGKTQAEFEAALIAYNKALELNNHHAVIYGKIAIIYGYLADISKELGNAVKVEEAYKYAALAHEEALKLSQNNPAYRYRAADLYTKKGMTEDANTDFKRALELYEEIKILRPEFPGIDEKINAARSNI
ncbi:hypothetical protein HOG48_01970 [Candidatus Peregrinibacteria bacterium]|jgi:O-antigen ligase|nr:hypothetical protein [Candidatus Peregrinibacteria bacterium]